MVFITKQKKETNKKKLNGHSGFYIPPQLYKRFKKKEKKNKIL